ncbi:MAG: hypothetical protein ISQ32_00235 [Rickettsiales bacterium]|nr:hypothetical protein [Rickettsiales bacterium]
MSLIPFSIFYLISYFFVIFSYLPSILSIFNGFFPIFETALAFFFLTNKDKKISYSFLLIIFILIDTIQNNIIGITATIFFLSMICFNTCKQLFVFENFKELWVGYALFCVIIFAFNFTIQYFLGVDAVFTSDIVIKLLLTIIFYPIYYLVISNLYDKTIKKYYNEKYLI